MITNFNFKWSQGFFVLKLKFIHSFIFGAQIRIFGCWSQKCDHLGRILASEFSTHTALNSSLILAGQAHATIENAFEDTAWVFCKSREKRDNVWDQYQLMSWELLFIGPVKFSMIDEITKLKVQLYTQKDLLFLLALMFMAGVAY